MCRNMVRNLKSSLGATTPFNGAALMLSIAMFVPLQAQAGLFKWIRNEALPTVSGTRQIEIKPYVSIKSGSTQFKLGQDSAMIKVGDVTVQTGKLRYRLTQAGCLYATGGDVMTCAPDVVEREARKLFVQVGRGIEANSDLPPPPRETTSSGATKPSAPADGPLKYENLDAKEIPWGAPTGPSIGYNFDPKSPTSPVPTGSSYFNSFAVSRSIDRNYRATVLVVGRIDFANLQGRKGGILCLFASEKGKYLRDRNGEYRDQYGVVALGSSATLSTSTWLELMQIQLIMPWSELEIPDDLDPYEPKFVQCNVTVDNKVTQALDWAPF